MWLPTDNPPPSMSESARPRGRSSFSWLGLLLVVCCMFQVGCVQRRVTLQSDPPGALVLIDGEERGYTPYSMDFIYYGTREIQLVKPGYETLTVMQKIPRPWYQVFPIEFFSDNLWPFRTTDRNSYFYRMQPHTIAPVEELLDRANGLRTESQVGR